MAQILIIDDDPGVGDILKRILSSEGHDVQSVTDSQAGVDLINGQEFDLAIVDIFMPKRAGSKSIRHSRKANRRSN